jgi:hypothetical protein
MLFKNIKKLLHHIKILLCFQFEDKHGVLSELLNVLKIISNHITIFRLVTATQLIYCLLLLREANYLVLTIRYELTQLKPAIFRLEYPRLKYKLCTSPVTGRLTQIPFFCDAEKKHALVNVCIYVMYM